MQNLKDLVKETAVFVKYRKGELHYTTSVSEFNFVVPVEDCGDGEFNAYEKGMLMMRYIRKQLEANKQGLEQF